MLRLARPLRLAQVYGHAPFHAPLSSIPLLATARLLHSTPPVAVKRPEPSPTDGGASRASLEPQPIDEGHVPERRMSELDRIRLEAERAARAKQAKRAEERKEEKAEWKKVKAERKLEAFEQRKAARAAKAAKGSKGKSQLDGEFVCGGGGAGHGAEGRSKARAGGDCLVAAHEMTAPTWNKC